MRPTVSRLGGSKDNTRLSKMTDLMSVKIDERQLALALRTAQHLLKSGASDSFVFSPVSLFELLAVLSDHTYSRGTSLA